MILFPAAFIKPSKNILNGETFKKQYDKHILLLGAKPNVANILGIEEANVFTIKDIVVNYAGYVASNLLNVDFKQVNLYMVRGLVEHDDYIINVRQRGEYDKTQNRESIVTEYNFK